MAGGKLGLGMGEQDKRVEELEDILKWVMKYVDEFLEGDDFEQDEMNRALIMNHKIKNRLLEKDARISELEKELQRRKLFGMMRR